MRAVEAAPNQSSLYRQQSVTIPDLSLQPDSYLWRVQGYTPASIGPWSAWQGFTVE